METLENLEMMLRYYFTFRSPSGFPKSMGNDLFYELVYLTIVKIKKTDAPTANYNNVKTRTYVPQHHHANTAVMYLHVM